MNAEFLDGTNPIIITDSLRAVERFVMSQQGEKSPFSSFRRKQRATMLFTNLTINPEVSTTPRGTNIGL